MAAWEAVSEPEVVRVPPPRPEFGAPAGGSPAIRQRPWWGLGDVALAIPVILAFSVAASVLAAIVVALTSDEEFSLSGNVELPIAFIAISTIGQQLGQIVWPWAVSKWKGFGMKIDWRWGFTRADIGLGLLLGLIAQVAAYFVSLGVSALVDLENESDADNTQILTDAEGSPWLWVMVAVVIIGAPLSEEVLFRGLVLRAFEKRAGKIIAVLGSTILFTVVHFTGAGADGTLVLLSSIGVVGLVLGIAAIVFDRLGPGIIAHMAFNTVGTAVALGWVG